MSLPCLSKLSLMRPKGSETSLLMSTAEGDELQAREYFYEGEISREDPEDPGGVLYSFKRYAIDRLLFRSMEVSMRGSYIYDLLEKESPPDIVDWNSETTGAHDAMPSLMNIYRYRIDLRLPTPEGGMQPFKSIFAMTMAERRTARLFPSMEQVQVKYLRSVWSQHYPATEKSDHFVPPEPILTSDVMTANDSSVALEESYIVNDIMRSFFTKEVWDDPERFSTDSAVKYMDKKRNYKHIALRKVFDAMEGTDMWQRDNMSSLEKERVFENALSYGQVDKSDETLRFFGLMRICLVVVLYRLLILTDDALTNMYVKSPDGPLHIMNLQKLHKEVGAMEPPSKGEIARLKDELEQLRRAGQELPRKAAKP